MKKCIKLRVIRIGLPALFIAQGGCATDKVAGRWCDYDIVANGSDDEWQAGIDRAEKCRKQG